MGFALLEIIVKPLVDSALGNLSPFSNPNDLSAAFAQLGVVLGAALGAVIGLANGLTGWLILQWRGYRANSWSPVSMIGWAAGLAISWLLALVAISDKNTLLNQALSNDLLSNNMPGATLLIAAMVGVVTGAILGVLQWLALRKQARRAAWWVLASPIAWALAMCTVALLANALIQSSTTASLQSNALIAEVIAGGIIGAVGGVTTGTALTLILR
jgi:hypothetical protein